MAMSVEEILSDELSSAAARGNADDLRHVLAQGVTWSPGLRPPLHVLCEHEQDFDEAENIGKEFLADKIGKLKNDRVKFLLKNGFRTICTILNYLIIYFIILKVISHE